MPLRVPKRAVLSRLACGCCLPGIAPGDVHGRCRPSEGPAASCGKDDRGPRLRHGIPAGRRVRENRGNLKEPRFDIGDRVNRRRAAGDSTRPSWQRNSNGKCPGHAGHGRRQAGQAGCTDDGGRGTQVQIQVDDAKGSLKKANGGA